jgi:acyl-coenzyme A thioesterase PaaI-like protein
LSRDLYLRATAVRVGRAVATVRVDAWQADPARPVAAGHGNFQLIAG